MRNERRPSPQRAGFLGRLRARLRRAEPDPTARGLFTARRSPTVGTRVPGSVVPVDAPRVTVHPSRLERPIGRVELTPSQALELAREGPEALTRRRPEAG